MKDSAIVTHPSLLGRLGRWQRLGLSVVLGALMTAGHPPVQVPWALFLAVPALALLVQAAPTGRAAAWIGWGAGFGYFVTGLHWIGHAFLVDADRFAWLMPLGVMALPAFLGLFWALAFWAARRLHAGGPVTGALMLAALWTVVEFARAHVLTGFPWALPGYVWVDTPAMQAVAWIGPFGMTLATLALCATIGVALIGRAFVLGVLALAVCAGIWIGGAARVPDQTAYGADAPVLRVVQPNAPQHLKWKIGHREVFYRRALEATAAPPGDLGDPQIMIWPETAVHFVLAAQPDQVALISKAAGQATVLMGALHGERVGTGERWSNSFSSILPDGTLGPRYDKHHLVPFGEYLPMQPVFDTLGLSQFAIRGGFTRGSGPRTITVPGVPPYSPLICYEAIFPHKVVGAQRPAWLVQPTNDAWFGSFAGPQQHYAQARIRAIEQGLPMVRAANTGISAVVDPFGRQIAHMPLHTFGHFDARLPQAIAPTLYATYGNMPAIVLILLVLAGAGLAGRLGGRQDGKTGDPA